MPDRPASCYRYFDTPAYTRRKYIRGVPGSKITKFDYGDPKGDFPVLVRLIPLEAGQIRHNALEAARVTATKAMSVAVGDTGYHLKVRTYPHQVLRENKMMAFAGADRLQDGMRRSFGKPCGTAARVDALQPIIDLKVPAGKRKEARYALSLACAKMPMPCRVIDVK